MAMNVIVAYWGNFHLDIVQSPSLGNLNNLFSDRNGHGELARLRSAEASPPVSMGRLRPLAGVHTLLSRIPKL
jgi:hypothetical protein